MTNAIVTKIAALATVAKVAAWNDRHYINLEAARGSRANADLRTKIWIKANILTIEQGKGYHSDAYIAAMGEIEALVVAEGGSVRTI